MKIREIMTTDLVTAEPETTAEEIAVLMRDGDTGAIPVVEDGLLIGIVTDRDIVVRCIAEGKDPGDVAAEEILSEELETVEPDDEVQEASQIMASKQIRRLPVVENGRLLGMLSLGDIAVKLGQGAGGIALRSVSRGVKATGKAPSARRAGRAASQIRGGSKASERANVRQGRQQTISNQGSGKEQQRRQRVVPIREEGRPVSKRKAS